MLGRRSGLERLLGDQALDPALAKAIHAVGQRLGRKELGQEIVDVWTDTERFLQKASRFQIRDFRDAVAAELTAADDRARERRLAEVQAAGGVAGGVGYSPRRTAPSVDMGFYYAPGGAIRSAHEDEIEASRDAARERTAAAANAARQQENAAEAAQHNEARAATAEYWRGRTPPGIPG